MQVTILAGLALFRYYNRIPSIGSSSSSSGLTPSCLQSGSALSTTSESIAVCSGSVGNASCSQSTGMSACDNSRKRKGTLFHGNRRRSNPVVPLLTAEASVHAVSSTLPSDSVVEIIALSSDGSASIQGLEIAESSRARKGKQKLPVIDKVDDQSDKDFVAGVAEKILKKNYDAIWKF